MLLISNFRIIALILVMTRSRTVFSKGSISQAIPMAVGKGQGQFSPINDVFVNQIDSRL